MTYKEHRKELLKDKAVRAEYEKLLPEYELAKSIIEQRLRKKMTQEDIAHKAGIPQSTVSRIEGLTHGLPKLSTLKKIANALDAKLIVKLEPKDPIGKNILKVKDEKPLTIAEARKFYGKKTRSY
ncbi:MAG: helix-turn-helix transcriptional regulator [Nitrospirota bacterium]